MSIELPPEQHSAAAWTGPDMAARADWRMALEPADIAEIESATDALIASDTDIATITAGAFPLPHLGPRLKARAQDEVLNGRGFLLIRGLPVERWSLRQSATAYFGLGAHLGPARSQNGQGHVLGHVQDLGLDAGDPSVRIYQTNARQTFHTDSCDVVALLCLKTAQSGGLSALVSATTIFNEMRRRRPDLLKLLFEPIATDRRGEVPEGCKPFFTIPVFTWHQGYLSAIYQRQYIDSAQRFPDAPRLTPAHVEALDLFDALADDPALNMTMEFRPGDVQLVHNHTLLHDRTEFIDWPEPERRRHLLRLWLAADGARPLPDVFAERYGSTRVGDRGGVIVRSTKLQAPLVVADRLITFGEAWAALSEGVHWQLSTEQDGALRSYHDRKYRLIHSWDKHGEEKVIDIVDDKTVFSAHLSEPIETKFYRRSDNASDPAVQKSLRQLLAYARLRTKQNA